VGSSHPFVPILHSRLADTKRSIVGAGLVPALVGRPCLWLALARVNLLRNGGRKSLEDQRDESLEWRSLLDALRKIPADAVRTTLGTDGVIAYTDGACIKNPGGPAGWSAILLPVTHSLPGDGNENAPRIECYGHIPQAPTTTNNRAEITAVLAVLCLAPPDVPLKIYSDSEYTIKVAQGIYRVNANSDLWDLYRKLYNHRKAPLTFEWVRGHAGHDLNERADELAGLGAWNGDVEAYRKWQESNAFEARNTLPPAEMAALRQQVQKLKSLFESIDINSTRVTANERTFVNDMAKRLQKNNFAPSEKQSNWIKVLVRKYKV
jgi:ribonuclease HI